jgi:hypothetical protein
VTGNKTFETALEISGIPGISKTSAVSIRKFY